MALGGSSREIGATAPAQLVSSPIQGPNAGNGAVSAPAISLLKGGGAIRGIGENFAANPVTGTASMTVPIATSPGRSGFGPQLSLSYDSSSGNGPFGFGWSLTLPSITRKTDKGLPRYLDADRSDLFILSGSEDLVPDLDTSSKPDTSVPGYAIHRYRPRIEGLFARIERWTKVDDPSDVHWRSISKDDVLTLYGRNSSSRITDPESGRRIFSWLIETRDDKGKAVLYEYKTEDGLGVVLSRACERNGGDRNDVRRTANRYINHIRYGNRVPCLDNDGHRPNLLSDVLGDPNDAKWMFELVFDYGEHDAGAPKPDDSGDWTYRIDPFCSHRAGFEVRTTRLCQRVLMFHPTRVLPARRAVPAALAIHFGPQCRLLGIGILLTFRKPRPTRSCRRNFPSLSPGKPPLELRASAAWSRASATAQLTR